jgi:2-hydroxychromene-2-carboxylate isomerase
VETVAAILRALGHDSAAVLTRANEQSVKDRLRANTEEAQQRGLFGAPSFVLANGEMFWGNDRLEQALAWAKR